MKDLIYRLEMGQRFFGSGSYNSDKFHEFFDDFKKSFTNQLRKLKANTISFSKGHFYISGFFKIGEQFYYFSISDVRDGVRHWDSPKMLMRTAKSAEDYTGGANCYVNIENGMWKQIAKTFRLPLPEPASKGKKSIEEIAQKIIKKGFADMYVGSMRKGNDIAWKVDRLLTGNDDGISMSIQSWRRGRYLVKSTAHTEQMDYYYDAGSKRIEINILEKPFNAEEFLKTLKLPKEPQHRRNFFDSEKEELLEPLAVALHDYIKEAEVKQSPLFQEALLLFRERYPDAYMTLLD